MSNSKDFSTKRWSRGEIQVPLPQHKSLSLQIDEFLVKNQQEREKGELKQKNLGINLFIKCHTEKKHM